MKFNKYHIGAAGAVLLIILIVVFVLRSDWDANKYILSADYAGNLNPLSESYFANKERDLKAHVTNEVKTVKKWAGGNSDFLRNRVIKFKDMFGPHNGATCHAGAEGHRPTQCKQRPGWGCRAAITCPPNTYAILAHNGRCNCASLTMQ